MAPAQGAAQGGRPGAAREPESGALRESVMHFEFDRQTDPAVLEALEADVAGVLRDVRAAVEDWKPMRSRLLEIAEGDDIANAPITPASARTQYDQTPVTLLNLTPSPVASPSPHRLPRLRQEPLPAWHSK